MRRLGRYALGRVLGEGGQGRVYEAVLHGPGGLRKPVAVKVLRRGHATLRREARIGGLLRHPNLVDVYEVGEIDGTWFCAMELCRRSLDGVGALSPRAVVEVGLAVCDALQYAHEALGLVHLDLKPANLLLSAEGTVKVADLGVARAEGFDHDGRIQGTPGFMAPEHAAGSAVDPRADIYALGVTLSRLASDADLRLSETLWSGVETAEEDTVELLDASSHDGPVPAWLQPVVERCLADDPQSRFPSMRALGEALEALPVDGPGLRAAIGWTPPPRPPRGEAPELGPLVGRDPWLVEVDVALSRRQPVVLRGEPGIGKSALAVAASRRREAPTVYVELGEATDVVALCDAVAGALGLRLRGAAPLASLCEGIGTRPLVLVLDTVEGVRGVAEAVATLHAACPRVEVVLTTRRALQLPDACELEVGPLSEADGASLLRLAARARGVDLSDPGSSPALHRLAAMLDGIPLALELAAGRLGVLTPDDLVDHLESDRGLELLRGSGSGRHGTLAAALSWSWAQLDEAHRTALCQLSVFVDGFTLEAAEEVATVASLLDTLDALQRWSLVRAAGSDRLVLPQSVRLYARAELEDDDGAVERHVAWAAGLDRYLPDTGPWDPVRLESLTSERANLFAACERALAAGRCDLAVRALGVVEAVVGNSGSNARMAELAQAILAREDLDPGLVGPAAQRAGTAMLFMGRVDQGEALLRQAVDAFTRSGDELALASALLNHGSAQRVLGYPDVAREATERALQLARTHGHENTIIRALILLGNIAFLVGQRPRAEEAFREAQQRARAIAHDHLELAAASNLGTMHMAMGDLDQAQVEFTRALALARSRQDRHAEQVIQANRGLLFDRVGDPRSADRVLRESVALSRELGARRRLAEGLQFLGVHLLDHRALDEAKQVLTEGLGLAEEVGDRSLIGNLTGSLGSVHESLGDLRVAGERYAEAIEIAEAIGDRRVLGQWLTAMGALRVTEGDLEAAGPLIERAEKLLSAIGEPAPLARARAARASLVCKAGDPERARALLDEAAMLVRDVHRTTHDAIVRLAAELGLIVDAENTSEL